MYNACTQDWTRNLNQYLSSDAAVRTSKKAKRVAIRFKHNQQRRPPPTPPQSQALFIQDPLIIPIRTDISATPTTTSWHSHATSQTARSSDATSCCQIQQHHDDRETLRRKRSTINPYRASLHCRHSARITRSMTAPTTRSYLPVQVS